MTRERLVELRSRPVLETGFGFPVAPRGAFLARLRDAQQQAAEEEKRKLFEVTGVL